MARDPAQRPWRWVGVQAAVAVILRDGRNGWEVLLIQRAHRAGDPWSGDISLPGGRRQSDDVTLAQTARRETAEEVGLDLSGVPLVGWLPGRLTRAHRQRRLMSVHPALFVLPVGHDSATTRSAEATATFWVPLAALRDPASRARRPWRVGLVTLPAPAWRVADRVIWGLTHAILSSLLAEDRLVPPRP